MSTEYQNDHNQNHIQPPTIPSYIHCVHSDGSSLYQLSAQVGYIYRLGHELYVVGLHSACSHGAHDEGEALARLKSLRIPSEVEALVAEDAEPRVPPPGPLQHFPHFVLLSVHTLFQYFLLHKFKARKLPLTVAVPGRGSESSSRPMKLRISVDPGEAILDTADMKSFMGVMKNNGT